MLLSSFNFLLFLFIVLIFYWHLPKKLQWIILLLGSYYFYASWNAGFILLIVTTTLLNYFAGIQIEKNKKHKLFPLVLGLIFNLGTLFIFKYLNFFSISFNQLFKLNIPQFSLMLPLGISFYTLQISGYLIDVYKNKVKAEKHLGHFALFTCFFPQILAGPIERSWTLLPQIKNIKVFSEDDLSDGIKLFTFGLFKKLVIADNIALVVDHGFNSIDQYKGLSLLLLMLFYSWQIYMDFSGYTDMARGVGKMLGINLLENFQLPYTSTSISNFWRKWHISLSSWLKDYIYIPLGGSRKGIVITVINTFIVFTISGLWHGASWNFILWGLLHGAFISMEKIRKNFKLLTFKIPIYIQILYTYTVISLLWVLFRANTLSEALYIYKNLFVGLKNLIHPNYYWATLLQLFQYNNIEAILICIITLIAIFTEIIQMKYSIIQLINKQNLIFRYAFYVLVIFLIIEFRNSEIKEFIYIRF